MRVFSRRARRVGRVLLILFLLLYALLLVPNLYVILSTMPKLRKVEDAPPPVLDCILVLGCGVRADGTPSPMLNDRLTRAVELYQAGWSDKILMSGDNRSQYYNELATMHRVAREHGVPEEDIVLDYAGLSTYDSIYRAKEIFGVRRMVIVTQEYHIYRALHTARALGINAWGVYAERRDYRGQFGREVREVLARDKDFVLALFKPPATILGDPEPLVGTPDRPFLSEEEKAADTP